MKMSRETNRTNKRNQQSCGKGQHKKIHFYTQAMTNWKI